MFCGCWQRCEVRDEGLYGKSSSRMITWVLLVPWGPNPTKQRQSPGGGWMCNGADYRRTLSLGALFPLQQAAISQPGCALAPPKQRESGGSKLHVLHCWLGYLTFQESQTALILRHGQEKTQSRHWLRCWLTQQIGQGDRGPRPAASNTTGGVKYDHTLSFAKTLLASMSPCLYYRHSFPLLEKNKRNGHLMNLKL